MKLNFAHILTIIFVVAKIMGAVTFSWWVVFSPMIVMVGILLTQVIIESFNN